jgi:hypothetical protein
MPEYLAPGVYVEETSFRAKSIEGVGTSTTAFVGPTRKGPFRADEEAQEQPELLTSFGDYVRTYGSIADLALSAGAPGTNHVAHGVLAFFNEGGGGGRGHGGSDAGRSTRQLRGALPGRRGQRRRHGARDDRTGLGRHDGAGAGRDAPAHRSRRRTGPSRQDRCRLASSCESR